MSQVYNNKISFCLYQVIWISSRRGHTPIANAEVGIFLSKFWSAAGQKGKICPSTIRKALAHKLRERDPQQKNRHEEADFFSHTSAVHERHYVLQNKISTSVRVGKRIANIWKVGLLMFIKHM